MVMMVLLKDAWICATASTTFFFTRLRVRAVAFAIVQNSQRSTVPLITYARRGAVPYGCGHWYVYVDRAPANHGDDAGHDSCRGPSGAGCAGRGRGGGRPRPGAGRRRGARGR